MEDETIAIYSSTNFSAEIAAKIFFSEHSESEVNNKLHELANLQVKEFFSFFFPLLFSSFLEISNIFFQ